MRLTCHLVIIASLTVTALAAEPYITRNEELPALARAARSALEAPVRTVVDRSHPSPSRDPHDYVSYARYYWPNPAKPDGLPYVQHDGRHNHEQVAKGDHERLGTFCSTVEKLAAAWTVKHDETAARRAGEWLRAWFISPATRMNPHMDYAQVRLGHDNNHGSPSGVLDSRGLAQVIDALILLQDSPALTPEEHQAVRAWFSTYLRWLETAKTAKAEHAAKNNHGSWFLAQAIPIARYVGRDDLARQLCEESKVRIGNQIRPDGSQPEEIRRVDGLGYSVYNLEALTRVARVAAGLGIDLWNHVAPNGASLRRALDFLRPYNAAPEKWPHSQKATLKPGFLDKLIAEADAARVKP
jgi:hypothetical protein